MALISKSFNLDMTPGVMPPVINVSEYDVNRQLIIFLRHNGGAFTPAAGTTAKIEGTLSNGFGFSEDADLSGNSVSFTLTESMTAVAGRAWVKVKLTNDGAPVSSCGFIMDVDRAGVEADTVIGAQGFYNQIAAAVDAWLDEHPSAVSGLSVDVKEALLDCFENVAWVNDDGQQYYQALYDALYPVAPPADVVSIDAVFAQGSAVIYDTDSLDTLKQYLVVTATMTDSTIQTLDDSDYTLSGTLTVGTSAITVTFGSKTTTFNVTVATHTLYALDNRAFSYEAIDTDVVLLDEDRDYTLAMDVNTTNNPTSGNGRAYRLLALRKSDDSGFTFTFGKGAANATTLACGWMGPYDSLGTPNAGRKRVVITHSKDSGSVTCYARMDSGSVETVTVSGTFTASGKTVKMGIGSGEYTLPTGTINKARIYDTVLSSDKINEFLGV